MLCRFCAAEMLRIILENQNCCAKMTDSKAEILAVEIIKQFNSLEKKRTR